MFRSDIFAEYKATRKEMPEDLVPQIPVIRRLFEGFRVPVFMEPMMEADDVIATLAHRGQERGLDVLIVTADKDARQLISEQIRIYNIRKNKVMDIAGLQEEWGIRPDQVVDFLALTGDSVDNVPGVPGIGEGFASTFLREFGTLDNLLANPGRVKGPKKQQALREHKETALRARAAGGLEKRHPALPRLGCAQNPGPRRRSLEGALRLSAGSMDFATSSSSGSRQRALPAPPPKRPGRPAIIRSIPPKPWRNSWTSSAASRGSAWTPRQPPSTPCAPGWSGLSFSWQPGEAWYLPVRGPLGGLDSR